VAVISRSRGREDWDRCYAEKAWKLVTYSNYCLWHTVRHDEYKDRVGDILGKSLIPSKSFGNRRKWDRTVYITVLYPIANAESYTFTHPTVERTTMKRTESCR